MSKINIKDYGYTEFYQSNINGEEFASKELLPARITEVHRDTYKIVSQFGENNAKLKGSIFYNEGQRNQRR